MLERSGAGATLDVERNARQAALDLLSAAEAVLCRRPSSGPEVEVEALAEAALVFAMAGTIARWASAEEDDHSTPGTTPLVLVPGGLGR